ncbi:integrase [Rhodovulum sulfidophilum]|uniref:site-specific integrase n=1 Tax=Rhodovulum sulfidophilum TaxID=35806 RepID=UPI0005A6689E|nr:tyrosine-type recombinase/integrase [Rhodovulum sulfidophilum]ANB35138.1 integrase [Rhodovulum sulfidophilum DSM 1374]ANB38960.1 integrase [Rhodovulum sulfidophilum]MCW2304562.1 integrase [Rhodovulum sulfidophilum]
MVKRTQRPYVSRRRVKGRTYYYFRRNDTFVRLPDNPDSPEFDHAYWACRSGRNVAAKTSFDALITSYLASPAFLAKAPTTRSEYRRTLDQIRAKNGPKDFTRLRRRDVIAARDTHAEHWRKANAMVEMLSILARHARDLEWIDFNPAENVEKLKGGSYEPWPPWALDAFPREAEGAALTAFHLGVGTGQRLGDLCKMEWSHYDGDAIAVVQGKTGQRLWVACPADLREYLDALPRTGRFIIAKNMTQPLGKRTVQRLVEGVRKKIGATAYVIHGWRYTAAMQLAEAGCSDSEIAAVTGHRTLQMVQKYRAAANQRRLSRQAQDRRGRK